MYIKKRNAQVQFGHLHFLRKAAKKRVQSNFSGFIFYSLHFKVRKQTKN